MSDWKLDKFEVNHEYDYKTKTTKYKGTVRFQNSKYESFNVKLSEQTTNDILRLILPDIAFASRQLLDNLWDNVEEQASKILKKGTIQ